MFFLFKKFYIPMCPNPNPFHLSPKAWIESWELISVIMIILSGLFLIYYYFATKPDPKGTIRFWWIVVLNIFISVIISLSWLHYKANSMIRGEDILLDRFGLTIGILVSSIISALVFTVVIYITLMIIAYVFKPKCRLRAMRRYPFRITILDN